MEALVSRVGSLGGRLSDPREGVCPWVRVLNYQRGQRALGALVVSLGVSWQAA